MYTLEIRKDTVMHNETVLKFDEVVSVLQVGKSVLEENENRFNDLMKTFAKLTRENSDNEIEIKNPAVRVVEEFNDFLRDNNLYLDENEELNFGFKASSDVPAEDDCDTTISPILVSVNRKNNSDYVSEIAQFWFYVNEEEDDFTNKMCIMTQEGVSIDVDYSNPNKPAFVLE